MRARKVKAVVLLVSAGGKTLRAVLKTRSTQKQEHAAQARGTARR